MEDQISSLGVKRPLQSIEAVALKSKLRSKEDYYVYFNKHCKYIEL